MGLKLSGRYVPLLLTVQIGEWTAGARAGACGSGDVGVTRAGGRGAGRRRDPPAPSAPAPAEPWRGCRLQGGEGGVHPLACSSRIASPGRVPKPAHAPSRSAFSPSPFTLPPSPPFSPSSRTTAVVSAFRILPASLSTDNLGTPALSNPSPPLPEGQSKKNRHKMACERSSRKVWGFFAENQGSKRRISFGNLETFSIWRAS